MTTDAPDLKALERYWLGRICALPQSTLDVPISVSEALQDAGLVQLVEAPGMLCLMATDKGCERDG